MSARKLALGAAWAASLVVAVVIARPGDAPAPAPGPTPGGAPAPIARDAPAPRQPGARGVSIDDVRRVIREEVHADPEAATSDVEQTPEVVAEARAVVRGAIDAGRWSERTRDELRVHMGILPRGELEPVMTELFVAINDGRIRVDLDGPLL